MDLLNGIMNLEHFEYTDTILFFCIVVTMIVGVLCTLDDLSFSSSASRVRKYKLLGYSTFRCIIESPIIFVIVGVVNLVLGILSICVFDKSINVALSIVIWCILLCILGLVLVCVVAIPISKIVYYCRLIVGKPNTLAGYYAYRMMQIYPTTLTTKHLDLGIYRFDKEQFNKWLADGAKLADNMNELASLEDKLAYIDNTIDYNVPLSIK